MIESPIDLRSPAQCRHRRLPVGEDNRGGQTGARPRARQAGKDKKAPTAADTQGFVLKAKVHAANVFDRDGIKPLMDLIGGQFPCLSYLWPVSGHNGKGKGRDWIEKTLRWTVEVV